MDFFYCFVIVSFISCSVQGKNHGMHRHASTIRAPAFPLAVRSPYLSVWLNSNTLSGNWPVFWTGTTMGWTGMVRIDGKAYVFMGDPGGQHGLNPVSQKDTYVTPTQTVFVIHTGPVELLVTFLSPVEYNDLKRQSIPMSYIFIKPRSIDGESHKVEIYMDISGEWASSDVYQKAKYSLHRHLNLKTWKFELTEPVMFAESDRYPLWGAAYFSASENAQHQSGPHTDLRQQFISTGKLDNSVGNEFRCIACNWPVIAFAHTLENVGPFSRREVQFSVGYVRNEVISLHGIPQNALWTRYFTDELNMTSFFFNDNIHAREFADEVDDRLLTEAFQVGGQEYADIIALSLRQAMAGMELSGTPEKPLLYLNGKRVQTVDMIFPTIPMWWHLNITNLEYLLKPLFQYIQTGFWTEEYALHDIGVNYPNVSYVEKDLRENMPIEESANMILMVASICLHPKTDLNRAKNYITENFKMLAGWAEYLHSNCLRPEKQLSSDIFLGEIELNSGLALKGILAMKAFSKLTQLIGLNKVSEFYSLAVDQFTNTWLQESYNKNESHFKMEYIEENSYQLKYNAFMDRLLGLNVIPEKFYKAEADFYLTKEQAFGTPFVSSKDYTKSDWEMWTAATFGDVNPTLKTHMVRNMANYLKGTTCRYPFPDWYTAANGNCMDLYARPVVGGHFALLAYNPTNKK